MVRLKLALSYKSQVSRLKNYYKLEIKDIEKAQELLRTVNYYRLSGYGIGLKQKDNSELYKDMNKKLTEFCELSPPTTSKIRRRREFLSIDVLYRIGTKFDSDFADMLSNIREPKNESQP